jgi:hypothetical protein
MPFYRTSRHVLPPFARSCPFDSFYYKTRISKNQRSMVYIHNAGIMQWCQQKSFGWKLIKLVGLRGGRGIASFAQVFRVRASEAGGKLCSPWFYQFCRAKACAAGKPLCWIDLFTYGLFFVGVHEAATLSFCFLIKQTGVAFFNTYKKQITC